MFVFIGKFDKTVELAFRRSSETKYPNSRDALYGCCIPTIEISIRIIHPDEFIEIFNSSYEFDENISNVDSQCHCQNLIHPNSFRDYGIQIKNYRTYSNWFSYSDLMNVVAIDLHIKRKSVYSWWKFSHIIELHDINTDDILLITYTTLVDYSNVWYHGCLLIFLFSLL